MSKRSITRRKLAEKVDLLFDLNCESPIAFHFLIFKMVQELLRKFKLGDAKFDQVLSIYQNSGTFDDIFLTWEFAINLVTS